MIKRFSSFRARAAFVALGALGLLGTLTSLSAHAGEAEIRKNLAARIPQFATIDEVSRTPMTGIFEVRINGSELYYTDAQGDYLMQGNLIDVRERKNLTEARVEKLTEVAFDKLPLQDAFKIVRGNGKRKLAIFEDPNCGYCKQFERDMKNVDNVTVYLFSIRCSVPTRPPSRATSGAPRTGPRAGTTGWAPRSSRRRQLRVAT